eukprot:m.78776 g.78776  ORF g.78776 m.78776 type:complete len:408 (+) comp14759_c0_seq1:65-1288(+)
MFAQASRALMRPLMACARAPRPLIVAETMSWRSTALRRFATAPSPAVNATATAAAEAVVSRSDKIVGRWLMGCSGLVFGAVVLGGVTRLTESGLSIVEWNPIRGVRPPKTEEEWKEQFALYQQFPEYKYNNHSMTLEEFKRIWYMEWFHRVWGRLVGAAFVIPGAYFLHKGWFRPGHNRRMGIFAALIAFQGALGWYMVKSGLDHDPKGEHVPRVSHYRLAAHLAAAFTLYTGFFYTGLTYLNPHRLTAPEHLVKSLRRFAHSTAGLVFLTAMSGALVAGLDAGLIYNSFPKMGDFWVPPEILQLSPKIRNFFDNSTTVQFDHRILGISTLTAVTTLFAMARRVPLHPQGRLAVTSMFGMVLLQVGLGISTLLYFVPTQLAATHQAGSLGLLSFALWFMHEIRRVPK